MNSHGLPWVALTSLGLHLARASLRRAGSWWYQISVLPSTLTSKELSSSHSASTGIRGSLNLISGIQWKLCPGQKNAHLTLTFSTSNLLSAGLPASVFSCSWVPMLNTGKCLTSLGVLFSSDIRNALSSSFWLDLAGHYRPTICCLNGCLGLFRCYFFGTLPMGGRLRSS